MLSWKFPLLTPNKIKLKIVNLSPNFRTCHFYTHATRSLFHINNNHWSKKIHINYSPTTSKYPNWLFIGSVLIWHIYHPLSADRTSLMCKYHVRWSLWLTPILLFFVITWLWIVRMVCVSTLNHATWKLVSASNYFVSVRREKCLSRVETITWVVLSLRCSGVDLFCFWGCFCLVCWGLLWWCGSFDFNVVWISLIWL